MRRLAILLLPLLLLAFVIGAVGCDGETGTATPTRTPYYCSPSCQCHSYTSDSYISCARAGAICNDGTCSLSRGSGTCSGHGGVKVWINCLEASKYLGIGRVLATGYAYQEGMPKREYDPDNPTGYKTGQWIDVEVIEGVMEFNAFHSQGEVIRGVWSYGGDVGIAGKPQVGDLVGYYRDGYCQIWEKVEGEYELERKGRS